MDKNLGLKPDDKSVTSGLPLLMVKGQFTSIDIMTIEDFESFIPFMTRCSINRARAPKINNVPHWWRSSLPCQFPLRKPKNQTNDKYRKMLRQIVLQCYSFHKQYDIIRICAALRRSSDRIVTKDNGDDTTTVFLMDSHLLTFHNHHQYYDRVVRQPVGQVQKIQRRKLLPMKVITNVYLCENCDAEFTSQSEITAHERVCYGWSEPSKAESSPVDLLGYLNLTKVSKEPPKTVKAIPQINLRKNTLIEFSSMLGRRLIKSNKRDWMFDPLRNIQQCEVFCRNISQNVKTRELRSIYKPLRQFYSEHSHRYYFTKREKRERYMVLKTGLNAKSRLLLKQMKPLRVVLNRIQVPLIPKIIPTFVDLCDDDS